MVLRHFHPLGKEPSASTRQARTAARARLPFDDERDFAEARRGFIAAPTYRRIMAEAGHVAWDMGYDFLLGGGELEYAGRLMRGRWVDRVGPFPASLRAHCGYLPGARGTSSPARPRPW